MIFLTIAAIVGVSASFGGLVVYLWLARMREDLREQRDFIDRWESLGLQPARHWAQVRREAYVPDPIDWHRNEHPPLSRGWWVEKAQRFGTWVLDRIRPQSPDVGRHRPERVEPGPITQEFERITADFDDRRFVAGYYSSATAHVLAAREVAR